VCAFVDDVVGYSAQARDELIDRLMPQRSRTTRAVIARNILARLTRWNPPAWVLDDLVLASRQEDLSSLRSLLLLHHARQETLLYGVRVNIAPIQLAGLLPGEVLRAADAKKAIADRARWRSDERRWVREGKLPRPGWLPESVPESPFWVV
jgi:hypothetical protein